MDNFQAVDEFVECGIVNGDFFFFILPILIINCIHQWGLAEN